MTPLLESNNIICNDSTVGAITLETLVQKKERNIHIYDLICTLMIPFVNLISDDVTHIPINQHLRRKISRFTRKVSKGEDLF